MTQGIVRHCGGRDATLSYIRLVPTPPSTSTYQPIGHGTLIDLVKEKVKMVDHDVVDEAYTLAREGAQMFGLMKLERNGEEITPVIGVRNSMDKSLAAGLVAGTNVFVCDNLAFAGEIKVTKKHTPNILDLLPSLIGGAVAKLPFFWAWAKEMYNRYKLVPLANNDAALFLMLCIKHDVLSSSSAKKLWEEYETPSFVVFSDRTLWSMFNAVTHILKNRQGLEGLSRKTQKLHRLADLVATKEDWRDM